MVLTSLWCTQQEPTITALHYYSKHGPKRPQKCRKTEKMTLFGRVFQISLVLKVIECHQSQHFYTLAKHIQKGSTTSKFQKKTFPHDKLSVPQVKFSCDFYFSSFGAATHGIKLPGETLSGAQLLCMSSKDPPHDWE